MEDKGRSLLPEKILIACVAENREPYTTEAYYLFRSLVQLGGPLARAEKVAYFIGEADALVVERLGELGVIVKVVEPVDKRCPHANKLAMLEDREEVYDLLIMLDCDIVIASDFLDVLSPDFVMAKPVDGDPFKMKEWEKLFHLCGVEVPKERFRTTWDYRETIPYFNSGVISVPARFVRTLLGAWKKNIDRLFDIYVNHPRIARQRFFTDQFAFALALQAEKIPYRALPLEMNIPIHAPINPSLRPESLEPYIIHHHHLFDEKGINPSSYLKINAAIGRVNAALTAPLPKEILEYRSNKRHFDTDRDLGLGMGAKNERLDYKRTLLRKVIENLRPGSVLDVCCGNLELTKDISLRDYHGLDISGTVIDMNRKLKPEWNFSAGDLMDLAEEKDLFSDMVICFDVLCHQPDSEKYRGMVEKIVSLTLASGIISGFEIPPRERFRNNNTFYHEPLTETLKRAGACDIKVIGNYQDTNVVRFSAKNASLPELASSVLVEGDRLENSLKSGKTRMPPSISSLFRNSAALLRRVFSITEKQKTDRH